MNGLGEAGGDGSGTIDPAALNPRGESTVPEDPRTRPETPRGVKRGRSTDPEAEENDDSRRRKRGRPPKARPGPSPDRPAPPPAVPTYVGTPQPAPSVPGASPGTPGAPAAKPTKTIKALPTVRDHTTDQLTPEGDEFVPREYDDAGERKVSPQGTPRDGRAYSVRTFLVPNRGNKLFMLATECARVLAYRDSYLLFNKNRSLHKIIATQSEKDDLIRQDILPFSYRSRQIAIVTARSMFRQFGSRVILGGRRVRDDYWEGKARKQGFTENDAAGEKRPGGHPPPGTGGGGTGSVGPGTPGTPGPGGPTLASPHPAHSHPDVVYSSGAGAGLPTSYHPHPLPLPLPLPMIHASEDVQLRDYGHVARPRHEMAGPAYTDRTAPGSMAELMNQAHHAADFNRGLAHQRGVRGKYVDEYWHRPGPEGPEGGPGGSEAGGIPSHDPHAEGGPGGPGQAAGAPYGESPQPAAYAEAQPAAYAEVQPAQRAPHQAYVHAQAQAAAQRSQLAQSPARGTRSVAGGGDVRRSPAQGGPAYMYGGQAGQPGHAAPGPPGQMWPPSHPHQIPQMPQMYSPQAQAHPQQQAHPQAHPQAQAHPHPQAHPQYAYQRMYQMSPTPQAQMNPTPTPAPAQVQSPGQPQTHTPSQPSQVQPGQYQWAGQGQGQRWNWSQ